MIHPGTRTLARRVAALIPRAAGALGVVAALALPAPAPAEDRRPNLLLVTLDTTRADRFAAWGGRDGVTPEADRLAARGTVFERAVAPSPSTQPSHASMLSGLEPARHGVTKNGIALPRAIRSVAQDLRAAGYTTAAFTSIRFLLVPSGLARGFETANAPRDDKTTRPAPATTQLALGWLRSLDTSRPFFAWVHYFDAHSPYELTPWASERLAGYEGPIRGTVSIADFYAGKWLDAEADRQAVRTRYDGLVHRADAGLGRLVAKLEARGLLRETVVLVTADHGQALGDHRHAGHAALWEPILQVPLIVHDGRNPVARRVRERVGLVDLGPTLLELAGLPVPEGVDGRSLVPALRGQPLAARSYRSHRPPPDPDLPAWFRRMRDDANTRLGAVDQNDAVYLDDWKIIDGAEGRFAFDLKRDPRETSPIDVRREGAEAGAPIAELVRLLEDAKRRAEAKPETLQVPEETLEALRALGYAE